MFVTFCLFPPSFIFVCKTRSFILTNTGRLQPCSQILNLGRSDWKWKTLQLTTIWTKLRPEYFFVCKARSLILINSGRLQHCLQILNLGGSDWKWKRASLPENRIKVRHEYYFVCEARRFMLIKGVYPGRLQHCSQKLNLGGSDWKWKTRQLIMKWNKVRRE